MRRARSGDVALVELFLPRTDLGVLVQVAATLVVGLPLIVLLARRGATEWLWFVGGAVVLLLAIFAYRTVL